MTRPLDDLTITRRCAQVMGYRPVFEGNHTHSSLPRYYITPKGVKVRVAQYRPLINNAQCLLIIKALKLNITHDDASDEVTVTIDTVNGRAAVTHANLNRAVCRVAAEAVLQRAQEAA